MNILIVGLVKNEQLSRLQEEGEKRGHKINGCYASELIIETDTKSFNPTIRGKTINYDLIYLWAVGKRRWEWYTSCLYLNKNKGTKIVNFKSIDPSYNFYLTPAIDYLKQVESSLPFPHSVIVLSAKSIGSVIKNFNFPLIIKVSEGRQGKGVFKAQSLEELKKIAKDLEKISPSFVIREFIPNDGDIRIFTVGYKAIGAMKRIPTKIGEFRSNISQGGRGEPFDLEKYPEIKNLAEKTSEVMKTEIAGVDIMINKETEKPYILEINPGPQFMGLEKYTGVNTALEIIKYFEKLLEKN